MTDQPPKTQATRPRGKWRRRVVVYGLVYAVVAVCLMGCADRLLLFPSRDRISFAGQTRESVPFAAGPLELWKRRSAAAQSGEPRAFVLVLIGNASRAEYEVEDTAAAWSELPVEAWGLNYPGFGASAGNAKLNTLGPAALAAYDALAQHAGGRPVFISANSIGTTAGLYVAARRPVAGLVLRNPPPLRQLILGHYGWWNLWLAAAAVALSVPGDLDSIANARHVKAPAIFLLSANDSTVPPQFQQRVVDAYAGPKQIVRLLDADHNSAIDAKKTSELKSELNAMWDTALPSAH